MLAEERLEEAAAADRVEDTYYRIQVVLRRPRVCHPRNIIPIFAAACAAVAVKVWLAELGFEGEGATLRRQGH